MTDYNYNNGAIGLSYTSGVNTRFNHDVMNRGWWNWVRVFKDGTEIASRKWNSTNETETLSFREGTVKVERIRIGIDTMDDHHYVTFTASGDAPGGTYRVEVEIADMSDGSWLRHQDTIKGTFTITPSYRVDYIILEHTSPASIASVRVAVGSDYPRPTLTYVPYEVGNKTVTSAPYYWRKIGGTVSWTGRTESGSTGDGGVLDVSPHYTEGEELDALYGFVVTYNANGGLGQVPTSVSTSQKSTSYTLTLPSNVNVTRAGYSFTGWSLDKNISEGATDTIRIPFGAITVYACWKTRYTDPMAIHYFKDGRWVTGQSVYRMTNGEWVKADNVVVRIGSKWTYWNRRQG